MADSNTGRKRSLTVTITKRSNGNVVGGYPKTYEGKNAFTWDGVTYPTLTGSTFGRLSYEDYIIRLEDYKQYVQSLESGLDINRDLDPNAQPCINGDGESPCLIDICSTTFEISKLDASATGYISNAGVGEEIYIVDGTEGTILNVTGVTTNGSEFKGWSEYPSGLNLITTGATFSVPLGCGKKYYFVIEQNVVASKDFCYYPSSTILDQICGTCNETVTVYYDSSLMVASGFTNVTWYSDFGLTTVVEDGFYKLTTTTIKLFGKVITINLEKPPIYTLVNGLVTEIGFCDANLLYCCV